MQQVAKILALKATGCQSTCSEDVSEGRGARQQAGKSAVFYVRLVETGGSAEMRPPYLESRQGPAVAERSLKV